MCVHIPHPQNKIARVGKYKANDTDTTAAGGGAPFIYTGFRPAFIMIKRAGGANSWCVYDDRRGGNDENPYVELDVAGAEQTNGEINICSNGFKLDDSGTEINYSTNEYLYWAIARHPFVDLNLLSVKCKKIALPLFLRIGFLL